MTVSPTLGQGAGPRTRRRATVWPVVVFGTAIGMLVAAGVVAVSGASIVDALGLPDAGRLTTVGLPVVRVVADAAAALTVGFLLLATVLVPPQVSGYLDVAGYRAVRTAAVTAGAWTVSALLMVPLTVSEALGRPVVDVLTPGRLAAAVPLLPTAVPWVVAALVAAVISIGCRAVLSWGWTVALLGVAVAGLLPVAASGHSAVGGSHDIATDSLVLHVVAAAIWVGGLVAVLALALSRSAAQIVVALPRFSAIAAGCWALMAVSGTANLAVRVPLVPDALFTAYGALAAAKIVALLLLGVLGHVHRTRTISGAVQGDRRALLRFGGAEVVLMLATIGLAVGLSRTAPPGPVDEVRPSRTGEVLGYDLVPPGPGFLLAGRLDLVFALLAGGMLVGYLVAVRRVRVLGWTWDPLRGAAWVAGCLVIVLATSSGLGRYGAATLGLGAIAQILMAFVAPVLLVAGSPLELARRTLSRRGSPGTPSPRGSLEWLLRRPLVRAMRRPLPTAVVFIGVLVSLPLGLLDQLLQSQIGRQTLDALLLSTGCLVAAAVSTRRRGSGTLACAVLAVPAAVGVLLVARRDVIAETYFRSLALPWVPDLAAEQTRAGVVFIVGTVGALPLLVMWLWPRGSTRAGRPRAPGAAGGRAAVSRAVCGDGRDGPGVGDRGHSQDPTVSGAACAPQPTSRSRGPDVT